MNSEHLHQFYGGEISDHFKIQGKSAPEPVEFIFNNDQKLGDIYNARVKPIGQIAVTNTPTNMSLDALIEKQPDPLALQLQATLSKVAQEYGLISDDKTNVDFKPTLRDQSSNDIQQANDAVLKALEELKSLGEI